VGEHLLDLGQSARGRFSHRVESCGGRRAEPERDHHRLLVVEQEGRQVRPRGQPVATSGAGRGFDLVAERSQPVDVSPQRPRADLEPSCELLARPEPVGLQEVEQGQGTTGGVIAHALDHLSDCGRMLTALIRTLPPWPPAGWPESRSEMIRTRGLTQTFRAKDRTAEAVKGITLDVEPGVMVAFIGPNWAGKSTTLRML